MTVVWKLEVARQLLGRAITPSSGCRCPDYNASIGGSPTSSHLVVVRPDGREECVAVDLDVVDMEDAAELTFTLFKVGFKRMGIRAKGNHMFVHADIDEAKNSPRLWTYDS